MEKVSMSQRALRVILSGVMVVGMTPIVMATPTITGAEQAQVAFAAEEQSTTIATNTTGQKVYSDSTHGFTVTYSGSVGSYGGYLDTESNMTVESTGGNTISKIELTVGNNEDFSDTVTTSKGTLSGNTSGSLLITCSDINSDKVTFGSSSDLESVQIKQVKIFYEAGPTWSTFGGCQWSIDNDGALTIQKAASPEAGYTPGQLPNGCTKMSDWPWYASIATITSVTVKDGVVAGDSLAWMFGDNNTGAQNLKTVDLSGLSLDNVKDMHDMFYCCSALESITWPESLNTSNVESMDYIFAVDDKLDSATRIGYMKDLLAKNGGKCTDWTAGLFNSCPDTSIDLTGLDMGAVTNLAGMFCYCEDLTSVKWPETLDTSGVTSMEDMFCDCSKLESVDLSKFDTSKVTNMAWMFYDCAALTSLDLSSFDTSQVTDMEYMFAESTSLATIYAGDGWNTDAVLSSDNMFLDCTALKGGAGTLYDAGVVDKTRACIDGGPSSATPGYLTQATRDIADCTIDAIADQTYTGSAILPTVTVKDGDKTLVAGTDYIVSYEDNVNVGTATGSIIGIGEYAGTKDFTFKIVAASNGSTTNDSTTDGSSSSAVSKTGDPFGGVAVVVGGTAGAAALALALRRRRNHA